MRPERMSEAVTTAVGQQRQTALWIIAILLAIIATTLVVRGNGTLAVQPAFADGPMAGARGVFAFTGQLDKNRFGLFMIDVDSHTVWCYEYRPATRRMKLVAARSFSFDRYLKDYNCDEPTVKMVQDMLDEQNRVEDRISGGVVAPDDNEEDEEALETRTPGFPR